MGKLKPINPTKAQIVANPQAAAHDYDNLTHKPRINGHELVGNKTGDELGLQGKLTAGENVTIDANGRISATGGTDDYEELNNKPSINNVTLSGNKTADDLGLQTTLGAGLNIKFRDDAGVKRIDWVPKTSYGITARHEGGSYILQLNLDKVANSVHVPSTSINNYESNFMLVIDPDSYYYLIPVPEKGFIFRTCTREPDPAFQEQTSHVFMRYITLDTKREFTRHIYKPYGGYEVDGGWIETNPTISTATVNQNGTITFTMSDGSTVTTTGESIIGPQGPAGADGNDYVLTNQDKTDIANIVLSELPTTQGVLYGNASD